MLSHHPDENLLAEYSAGSLPWAISLGVAAHMDFCADCRSHVASLNRIGAVMLTQCQKHEVEPGTFELLMSKLCQREAEIEPSSAAVKNASTKNPSIASKPLKESDPMLNNLPKVVAKLLPNDKPVQWKSVSTSLKMARLKTGQNQYEVAFHKICVGGKVAEHDHKGLEVTVVLKGSFSDADGVYTPGDFLVRQRGEVHRPTAAQNEDCLCFSIAAAPVKLTGLLGTLVNPFLSIRPS